MDTYRDIDMKKTGKQIKKLIDEKGFRVSEIQNKLYLSCPQPIYRWMNGQILPSVNHLFMLSKILNVHMEDIIVEKNCVFKMEINLFSLGSSNVYLERYSEKWSRVKKNWRK